MYYFTTFGAWYLQLHVLVYHDTFKISISIFLGLICLVYPKNMFIIAYAYRRSCVQYAHTTRVIHLRFLFFLIPATLSRIIVYRNVAREESSGLKAT